MCRLSHFAKTGLQIVFVLQNTVRYNTYKLSKKNILGIYIDFLYSFFKA
jgi:hypothetical protein